jgi:hypothetical protein
MSTNYPTSLDNGTTIPNPTGVNTQNNPDHASLHSNTGDGLKAVEAKVGIGASTPTANTLLFGTGTGTSAWTALTSAQLAATLSDETGTGSAVFATTPTLVTPKVDTINESTPANGTTIGGVNIKSGALNTNNSVVTANITDSAVTYAKVAVGMPVQVVSTNYSAVATGTTVIPTDDTIPQITEGTEFMTQAITPKSATNRLSIEVSIVLSNSAAAAADLIAALFQDATANAIAATVQTFPTSIYIQNLKLTHDMLAATTSSTTFRVRGGCNSAGTTTFNGQSSVRRFGGITISNIKVTEYKA